MKILVTGGAGYIGTHTCIELLHAGFTPIVFDNLSNSSTVALERVEQITGTQIPFIKGDVLDAKALDKVFQTHDIYAVIHFAGLKAVGESVEKPILYYVNNVSGSINLFAAMERHKVTRVIFMVILKQYLSQKIFQPVLPTLMVDQSSSLKMYSGIFMLHNLTGILLYYAISTLLAHMKVV